MISLVAPIIGSQEKKLIREVLDSGIVASGTYVTDFEKMSARAFGVRYSVASSSGTTALHAALLACGVGKHDKVITTPLSFIATANSVLYCNAKPVFADVDSKTLNLSPEHTEKILSTVSGIKAILVVHLYGIPADMKAFVALAKKYKVALIEDCAQAHGAQYRAKPVGSIGDAGAFSYYATKNVMSAEGGLITTQSKRIDTACRMLINHGRASHSLHTILGYNYRLTNIAAAFGIAQMKHLSLWNTKRRDNAAFLSKELADLSWVTTPHVPRETRPVFHQYTIRVPKKMRAALQAHLQSKGVGCGVYYPIPIHKQPLYRDNGYARVRCPEAERAADEVLSLPVHPKLTHKDLRAIVAAVRSFS